MTRYLAFIGAVLLSACSSEKPVPLGIDELAGEEIFGVRCAVCHSVQPSDSNVAPSLGDFIGREVGTGNYEYSEALKNSTLIWNAETLNEFLLAPRELLPDNQMAFFGIESEQERRQLIAYLMAVSDKNK